LASVFLSYVREDADKARALAAILERSGHSVWWDRQIKGGAQYSAEIEAALDAAEKVVVLWSAKAVGSAWVRDEAAAGRDTGRLVPVTLDGTAAPLGFRQFQTIDLSHWNGRSSAPAIKQLLEAVGSVGPIEGVPPVGRERMKLRLSRPMLLGATAILAAATAAALVWTFWPSGAATPTFAIIAADGSAPSQQLAADVATRVGGLRDPAGADFHVTNAGPDQFDKGYALKVGAGSAGGRGQTLTLLSGKDNAILWSASLDLPQANPNDIGQAVALTAQRALSCAADALTYRRETISQETLRLYLTGCSSFDAAYGSNTPNQSMSKLFEQVIAKAPHFTPAWSKLFTVETEDLSDPFDESLPRRVRSQLDQVKKLGIDIPEAYAVKANLLSPIDFVGFFRILDEGIAKFPDNAFLLRIRGERYSYVGRMNDAVADSNQALQVDPLSPANHQEFANELAYSGDPAAGYAELRKAEQLWPNSLTVGMARYRMDLRFGDPHEAQALYLKYAAQTAQNPAQGKFIEARISSTPENIEAALEAERKINRQFPPFISSLAQALAYFGRKDDVIDLMINYPQGRFHGWFGYNAEVMFRPYMREVWRDPRSIAGAAHVGLLSYWKKSGKWPDFCFDPKLPYDCKKEAAKYPV